ncbi:MAG TPA: adenosylcobinamide amidohydrolase [Streptosporangiaceae bacterium]|nr:adenosylcobinamide amidohydrolase [Streptosporangiaceae bacterium]
MMDEPELLSRREDGAELAMALWRFGSPLLSLSSAPYGGGWGERQWVLAAQVSGGYSRPDPADHLAELAGGLRLDGPGIGMLTAVDVRLVSTGREDGVTAAATVGLSHPTWAAGAEAGTGSAGAAGARAPAPSAPAAAPGTVNIIAVLSRRLCPAALVNAVMTVTEAKSQALWEAGFAGTGTPSDAVAVLCPAAGPAEAFAGPRSRWGSRLARAVHAAVLDGSIRWAAAR